jgi:hypothetical protein
MKQPENFTKIDGIKFTTKTGNEYIFATDGMSPELWLLDNRNHTKYALAFIMIWETETYEIKIAESGKGSNWIDTIYSGGFTSQPMKTMSSFVDWAHHRVLKFEHNYYKL